MTIRDLLGMSLSNLKRRKLRTFLTVLGVIIGTASIVVMISLGLGLQQSMYDELDNAGGLTMLTVTGKGAGEMWSAESESDDSKYITDETIAELQKMDHVEMAAPYYNLYVNALKGGYMAGFSLIATTEEAMEALNIPLKPGGTIPKAGGNSLDVIYGNGVIEQFYEKGTGKGYWETGELPDIDLEHDSVFMILDTDNYNAGSSSNAIGSEGEDSTTATKPPKKYLVHASGVVEGDLNTYTNHYYNVYCNVDTLRALMKKEFAGRVMPGQPKTKSGKPYRFFAYSSAKIKVDDLENVDALTQSLREKGFNVDSNMDYMKSMQREFFIVEAVLGGIGAVSLLVAAIGIANTMMMSIYERTKEIGVFKVLGCSLRNIRQMFLLEAGFIGLLGGVIGNILSILISLAINFVVSRAGGSMGVSGNISYIPIWLMLASIGFAVLVGMVAGFFPAKRAMQLSPLEAIRNS